MSAAFLLKDGTPVIFIPKTHALGRRNCCPLCDGVGTVELLTVAHIVRVVADHYGLEVRDILSERRKRTVARPRQVAMYMSRKLTGQSLPCIGRKFSRDHTTIIHAIRETEKRMVESLRYQNEVSHLMELAAG